MIQHLPYSGFKWVKDVNKTNFWDVPDDNDKGYFLEVDLRCPPEVHDKLSDLPPCPEHRTPPGSKLKKLLTTLYDKKIT